ncbi:MULTISPECIES: hypothetical protein [Paraclostridium]|uniref:SRPBCC family protein n=1 Tax=Paraclostridium bifermentans TaxID=1490 RepID=A0A5P3XCH0_PARBF|nr:MULTISPECIES: hypothetical protein [Paraclostridium]MBN8046343.1 hypothetical protein [Paraclostridium bifermentans]MBZ6005315.1 hypothetical protein [Paraclostridium bifermentans]MDU0297197.1 hypothetical protein [Paraclostridium sp. MRS3W1]NME09611.1 hypothetical protein [Paraclostridium bifermentans]QEZ68619.1 hypothetical protein D4A35_06565 [Paraclostridium bifermentans]
MLFRIKDGYYVLQRKILVRKKDILLDSLFLQIYNQQKFSNWITQKPFVELIYKNNKFDVGTISTLKFGFFPFSYSFISRKVEKNKYIEAEIIGRFEGKITSNFIENEETIMLEHTIYIKGKNKFTNVYYLFAGAIPHTPYMKSREKLMIKNAMIDSKKGVEENA